MPEKARTGGRASRGRWIPWVVSSLVALALVELLLARLVSAGRLEIDRPSYYLPNVRSEFWVDIDPVFGVWHRPHSSYRHVRACFDVVYRANSYGARDRERARRSDLARVIVVGDSFIEGYGVPFGRRLSDLLEARTGLEHLNFGSAGHFGPLQYALVYESLARDFDHEAVLVGILPCNDFTDDDPDYARVAYAGRYRPTLEGAYPDYRLVYPSAAPARRAESRGRRAIRLAKAFLREYTYTYRFLWYLKEHAARTSAAGGPDGSERYSGYYDFTDAQFDRMRYALERLVKDAGGRPVAVVAMPLLPDLLRYEREGRATPRLSERLGSLCAAMGVEYLDLLPLFHERKAQWDSLYLPCDGHWSAAGHEAAEEMLRSELPLYAPGGRGALEEAAVRRREG